jgi:hypothetical protein
MHGGCKMSPESDTNKLAFDRLHELVNGDAEISDEVKKAVAADMNLASPEATQLRKLLEVPDAPAQ